MGRIEAIFAPFEKELLSNSLFIILHKCESKMLADILLTLVGLCQDL